MSDEEVMCEECHVDDSIFTKFQNNILELDTTTFYKMFYPIE